jgi:glycosyltransferase involved in cell wall biosynthesis
MTPGIEVVICTYNGAARLPRVLAALAAQSLAADYWSVLIVDNGSSDGTAEKAPRAWTRSDVPLRVVIEQRPGVTMARQRAFAEAIREFICFCDDDNLLAADYLEQALTLLQRQPSIGALGGQGLPVTEGPLPPWFSVVAGSYAVGPQAEEEGPVADSRGYLYGAGLVIRCSAWAPIRAAGFEPRLMSREGGGVSSGEDNEICLMLRLTGWKIYYSPRLVFQHLIGARKLEEAYCRALYRGFGEASAILNVYRDFALGRATITGWRTWAAVRLLQGWWVRTREALVRARPEPVSLPELQREINRGYAAGCQRVSRRGGLFGLYRELAHALATLPRAAN